MSRQPNPVARNRTKRAANARLIAAVPDLLAACKEMRRALFNESDTWTN